MLLPTAVTAQSRAASTPFGQPMRGAVTMDDVMISVRTTLIALDQANKTGNYSVFRDIASTEFRKNSLENIAKLFERGAGGPALRRNGGWQQHQQSGYD